MTVYHFNYEAFKSEVCSDVNDCLFDLHILSSDVDGIDEANELFSEYLWYEHDLAIEASYGILKHGVDPDSDYADAIVEVYAPIGFDEFLEFKKNEKRYKNL